MCHAPPTAIQTKFHDGISTIYWLCININIQYKTALKNGMAIPFECPLWPFSSGPVEEQPPVSLHPALVSPCPQVKWIDNETPVSWIVNLKIYISDTFTLIVNMKLFSPLIAFWYRAFWIFSRIKKNVYSRTAIYIYIVLCVKLSTVRYLNFKEELLIED